MTGEPTIAVGLVEGAGPVTVRFDGEYVDATGRSVPPGEARFSPGEPEEVVLTPVDTGACRFSLQATIGIDFHWQQKETQTFVGRLRILREGGDRLVVVNDVPLESYITSVVCSEMRSTSPPALIRAHAVVSRSWLLAGLEPGSRVEELTPPSGSGEVVRWYDREAHARFDVCADDHCQRYQGVGRIESAAVVAAIRDTRGQVLTHAGRPCDARFSKCCGGVTEDFRAAWSDTAVPYLVPRVDGPATTLPDPPLTAEDAMRRFIQHPPDVHCNCADERILGLVLNDYDQETRDFFRWQVRLTAERATHLVLDKLGVDLGRILSLEPVERGLSGRLVRLRLRGEAGSLVVGKELEIRRVLSDSHLYSSAFVVDPQGPPGRPDAFVLSGAGWGHGVGLCQIGAAAMASTGAACEGILEHYYPGTSLERLYD